MRTIYFPVDPPVGAGRRRHQFSFGEERATPSGAEALVSLNGHVIGTARRIDYVTPRGRPVQMFEVQLRTSLYVASGENLRLACQRVLPHALRLTTTGSAG